MSEIRAADDQAENS